MVGMANFLPIRDLKTLGSSLATCWELRQS